MESVRAKLALTCILLVLALGGTVVAAHETLGALQDLRQHASQVKSGDVHLIRAWMTVPYIAHTYHVPDQMLYQALHIKNTLEAHHSTLTSIAAHMKRPVETLVAKVQQAIVTYRRQHPRHSFHPTPVGTPEAQKGPLF